MAKAIPWRICLKIKYSHFVHPKKISVCVCVCASVCVSVCICVCVWVGVYSRLYIYLKSSPTMQNSKHTCVDKRYRYLNVPYTRPSSVRWALSPNQSKRLRTDVPWEVCFSFSPQQSPNPGSLTLEGAYRHVSTAETYISWPEQINLREMVFKG